MILCGQTAEHSHSPHVFHGAAGKVYASQEMWHQQEQQFLGRVCKTRPEFRRYDVALLLPFAFVFFFFFELELTLFLKSFLPPSALTPPFVL